MTKLFVGNQSARLKRGYTLDDLEEGGKYEINGKKYSFSDGLFTEE